MNEKRDEILNILNLNVAHCLLKKNMANEAIKHCKEALTHVK
jgi:tetratricopeptide (TPR) repeat protein